MSILTGQALRNYLIREAKKRGLDPRAVLAVASVEGGFYGAVGDHGTSFGPFQLHVGGALPKGLSGARARAWAQSAAGIAYALNAIAGVAAGKTGYGAVHAIVYGFEHPADPAHEVANAWGAYGGGTPPPPSGAGGGSASSGSAASASSAPQADQQILSSQPDFLLGAPSGPETSQPAILSPGAVQASAQPQQMADTWQLLAAQPLAGEETRLLAQRAKIAAGG